MRSNNLPHPSTLSLADWATPHEAVTNPLSLLLNTGHLLGGFIGNTFSMNSNPADQSWDETGAVSLMRLNRGFYERPLAKPGVSPLVAITHNQ